MKAPDQIYLQELSDGTWDDCFVYESSETDTNGMKRVPYIRKEALLEWINTSKNSLLMDTKAPHLGKVGSLATLDALTDILNSM